jgi:hypothetical protein
MPYPELIILPGAIYLISMYYTRAETQKRMTVLFVANLFAIATTGVGSQPSNVSDLYSADTTSSLHTT